MQNAGDEMPVIQYRLKECYLLSATGPTPGPYYSPFRNRIPRLGHGPRVFRLDPMAGAKHQTAQAHVGAGSRLKTLSDTEPQSPDVAKSPCRWRMCSRI